MVKMYYADAIFSMLGATRKEYIEDMRNKREKFIELAEARVTRAMRDIRLIGNLSNRSAYTYTEEDVRKIFKALQKELETARSKFGGDVDSRERGFTLED